MQLCPTFSDIAQILRDHISNQDIRNCLKEKHISVIDYLIVYFNGDLILDHIMAIYRKGNYTQSDELLTLSNLLLTIAHTFDFSENIQETLFASQLRRIVLFLDGELALKNVIGGNLNA